MVIPEFKRYWETVSYGKFKISSNSKLIDAGTLNKNQSDYGSATASGSDINWPGFVTDTRSKATTVLSGQGDDINNYEKVIIVHAGHSEQDTGGSSDKLSTSAEYLNGVNAVFSEFDILSGSQVWIYTMAHEFGHLIGLPDNYDYQIPSQPAYTGSYGLMGFQWNGATPTAVDKISLGWVNVIDVSSSTLILKASEFLDTTNNNVYKVDVAGSGEYIIEAKERSADKFDPAIDSGILVYYHDPSIPPTSGNVYRQTILLTPENDIYPLDFDIYNNDKWKNDGQSVAPSKFNANILDKWAEEIVDPVNQVAFSFRETSVKIGQSSGIPNDHQYILDIATTNLNPSYELNEFKFGTLTAKNALGLDVGKVKYTTTSAFIFPVSDTFHLRTGFYTDIWAAIGWTTKYKFNSTILYAKIGNFEERATWWEMQNTSKENWPALPSPYSGGISFGTPVDTTDWKLSYEGLSSYWTTKLERKTEIDKKDRIRWKIKIPKALSQTIPDNVYPSISYDIQGNFYSLISSGTERDYSTSFLTVPRNLGITINEPTSLIDVGNPSSPNHFTVKLAMLPHLVKEQIAVEVGNKYADYSLTENSGIYILDITPPPQEVGTYDLIVEAKIAGNLYSKNGGNLIRYTGPAPPSISNIYTIPSSPKSSDSVHVYAGISDPDGVSSAQAKWSLDQSFSNTITMTNIGGDSYKTNSPIPAQSTGTTVNYKVCAADTKGNSGCGSVYSYTVGVSNQAPVVGVPSLNPNPAYQGQTVSVTASVTDSNGNSDISTVTAKVQNGVGYVFSQSTLSYNSGTGAASGSITAPSQISSDYYVVVTATDKSGLEGSNQAQLTVKEPASACKPPSSSLLEAPYSYEGAVYSSNASINPDASINTSINVSLLSSEILISNKSNTGIILVPLKLVEIVNTSSNITPQGVITTSESLTLRDSATCKGYDANINCVTRTSVFSPSDTAVYTWYQFSDAYESHYFRWYWIKPDGNYYVFADGKSFAEWTLPAPSPGYYYPNLRLAHGIYVNGYDVAGLEGPWEVRVYLDGNHITTLRFNIKYIIADHTMAKGHDTNYDPVTRTSTFSRTDEKAESWLRLDKVTNSLNLKWDWYEPSGALYATGSTTSADPIAQGYPYWDSVKGWSYTCVNGYSAADKPGKWEVKVNIDNEYKYSELFTITDDLVPSVGSSHSPQSPTDQDSVSITVSANDNAGLNKIELYWNDGSWRTETWNSPGNPFSGTKNLGKLGIGKTIQYYAIAYDTSLNTKQTSTNSFSVSDGAPPSISVSHSPINPTDKDNILLNINANDNSVLTKVELYWNNGTLQTQTWYPNSNSFSLNYNIGTFEGSKVVQYYAKAYDGSGKTTTTNTYSFTPRDTTPPPKPNPKANPSGWTDDQTPTIYGYGVVDYGSGVNRYEYQIDSTSSSWTSVGTSTSFETPVLSGGEHIIYIRAIDNEGLSSDISNVKVYILNTRFGSNVKVELGEAGMNVSFANVIESGQTSVSVSNIGNPPPASFNLVGNYYDLTTTAKYSGNINVCINYNEAHVVKENTLKLFHYENGNWADVTTSLDTNANIICGTVTSLSEFIVAEPIDTTAPTTTAVLSGVPGNNGWNISDVQITLTAADNVGGLGVNKTEYSLDGTNWIKYTIPFAITDEGITTVYYRSTDNAGNVESTKEQIIKIDKTKPDISISGVSDGSYYNLDVTPVITITDSNLDAQSITLNGAPFVSGTVVSAEASYALIASGTDKAGNSDSKTLNFVIDKTKPGISISGVTDGSYYNLDVTPVITITDSNLDTQSITLNGAPFVSGTVVSAEGSYALVASATDKADNSDSKPVNFVVDKTKPSIDISGVSDGSYYNLDVTPVITIMDSNLDIQSITLNGAPFVSGTVISSEGSYALVTSATDEAGNSDSKTINFVVDKTKPDISISGVSDGSYYNLDVTPVITITDSNLDTQSITLNGAPFVSGTVISAEDRYALVASTTDKAGNSDSKTINFVVDKTKPDISISGVSDGSYYNLDVTPVITITDSNLDSSSITLNGSPFTSSTVVSSEGSYAMVASATDKAGNSDSKTINFVVDKTKPDISISGVSDGSYYNIDVTPVITITDSNLDTQSITLNGAPFVSDTVVSSEGSYALIASGTDKAGNSDSKTVNFVVDKTKPDISISGVSDGSYYNLDVTPVITITDSNLDTQSITLNGAPFTSGTVVSAEGSYALIASGTDKAGNSDSRHVNFVIDKTKPSIDISGVSDGSYYNLDVTPVITITDSNLDTQSITLNGAPFTSGTVVSAEGSYAVVASGTDKAGNSDSKTVNFVIDKTKPDISISGVSDGSYYSNDVTPVITITDSNLDTQSITLNGAPFTSGTVVSAEGSYTLVASATDKAGNSDSKTVNFVIDRTAPEASIGFDAVSKDFEVYNNETGGEADYTVLPFKMDIDVKVELNENLDKGWEPRQYTIEDSAKNSLVLVLNHKKEGKEAKVEVISMQYNGGAVITAAKNKIQAEYSEEENGAIKELGQKIEAEKLFNAQTKYSAKKDETEINVKVEGQAEQKETRAGIGILELSTDKGGLKLRYY